MKILKIVAVILAVLTVTLYVLVNQFVGSPKMVWNAITGEGIETPEEAELQQRLTLPAGFEISIYQGDLTNARAMALTSVGDIVVSRPHVGEISLVRADANSDGRADGVETLMAELSLPYGLVFIDDWLYFTDKTNIKRVKFDHAAGQIKGTPEVVVEGLPGGGNHWVHNLYHAPDGWLYVSNGSSCNVCEEEDPRRAAIMRVKPDGSNLEMFATGLRNTTAFTTLPWNGQFIGADIGRDLLGDTYPPEEINVLVKDGFYGWPYFNADNELDPDLGAKAPADVRPIAPVHNIQAHTTPLDIHVLRHPKYAKTMAQTALITLHGSWNRKVPAGYEVVALRWGADGSIVETPFLSGFLRGKSDVSGRPVDFVEDPEGNLYLSDDYAGAIYKIRYVESN